MSETFIYTMFDAETGEITSRPMTAEEIANMPAPPLQEDPAK